VIEGTDEIICVFDLLAVDLSDDIARFQTCTGRRAVLANGTDEQAVPG
jgi:hypothetical protein